MILSKYIFSMIYIATIKRIKCNAIVQHAPQTNANVKYINTNNCDCSAPKLECSIYCSNIKMKVNPPIIVKKEPEIKTPEYVSAPQSKAILQPTFPVLSKKPSTIVFDEKKDIESKENPFTRLIKKKIEETKNFDLSKIFSKNNEKVVLIEDKLIFNNNEYNACDIYKWAQDTFNSGGQFVLDNERRHLYDYVMNNVNISAKCHVNTIPVVTKTNSSSNIPFSHIITFTKTPTFERKTALNNPLIPQTVTVTKTPTFEQKIDLNNSLIPQTVTVTKTPTFEQKIDLNNPLIPQTVTVTKTPFLESDHISTITKYLEKPTVGVPRTVTITKGLEKDSMNAVSDVKNVNNINSKIENTVTVTKKVEIPKLSAEFISTIIKEDIKKKPEHSVSVSTFTLTKTVISSIKPKNLINTEQSKLSEKQKSKESDKKTVTKVVVKTRKIPIYKNLDISDSDISEYFDKKNLPEIVRPSKIKKTKKTLNKRDLLNNPNYRLDSEMNNFKEKKFLNKRDLLNDPKYRSDGEMDTFKEKKATSSISEPPVIEVHHYLDSNHKELSAFTSKDTNTKKILTSTVTIKQISTITKTIEQSSLLTSSNYKSEIKESKVVTITTTRTIRKKSETVASLNSGFSNISRYTNEINTNTPLKSTILPTDIEQQSLYLQKNNGEQMKMLKNFEQLIYSLDKKISDIYNRTIPNSPKTLSSMKTDSYNISRYPYSSLVEYNSKTLISPNLILVSTVTPKLNESKEDRSEKMLNEIIHLLKSEIIVKETKKSGKIKTLTNTISKSNTLLKNTTTLTKYVTKTKESKIRIPTTITTTVSANSLNISLKDDVKTLSLGKESNDKQLERTEQHFSLKDNVKTLSLGKESNDKQLERIEQHFSLKDNVKTLSLGKESNDKQLERTEQPYINEKVFYKNLEASITVPTVSSSLTKLPHFSAAPTEKKSMNIENIYKQLLEEENKSENVIKLLELMSKKKEKETKIEELIKKISQSEEQKTTVSAIKWSDISSASSAVYSTETIKNNKISNKNHTNLVDNITKNKENGDNKVEKKGEISGDIEAAILSTVQCLIAPSESNGKSLSIKASENDIQSTVSLSSIFSKNASSESSISLSKLTSSIKDLPEIHNKTLTKLIYVTKQSDKTKTIAAPKTVVKTIRVTATKLFTLKPKEIIKPKTVVKTVNITSTKLFTLKPKKVIMPKTLTKLVKVTATKTLTSSAITSKNDDNKLENNIQDVKNKLDESDKKLANLQESLAVLEKSVIKNEKQNTEKNIVLDDASSKNHITKESIKNVIEPSHSTVNETIILSKAIVMEPVYSLSTLNPAVSSISGGLSESISILSTKERKAEENIKLEPQTCVKSLEMQLEEKKEDSKIISTHIVPSVVSVPSVLKSETKNIKEGGYSTTSIIKKKDNTETVVNVSLSENKEKNEAIEDLVGNIKNGSLPDDSIIVSENKIIEKIMKKLEPVIDTIPLSSIQSISSESFSMLPATVTSTTN